MDFNTQCPCFIIRCSIFPSLSACHTPSCQHVWEPGPALWWWCSSPHLPSRTGPTQRVEPGPDSRLLRNRDTWWVHRTHQGSFLSAIWTGDVIRNRSGSGSRFFSSRVQHSKWVRGHDVTASYYIRYLSLWHFSSWQSFTCTSCAYFQLASANKLYKLLPHTQRVLLAAIL